MMENAEQELPKYLTGKDKAVRCTGADALVRDHIIRLAESVEVAQRFAEVARARLENAMEHFGWVEIEEGIAPSAMVHPYASRAWKIETSVLKGKS